MKSKIKGLIILIAVMAVVIVYVLSSGMTKEKVSINGYLGGEKIGFFEDEEVQNILKKKYGLTIDYSKAGSIEMMDLEQKGMDYLFPSSQVALEIYKQKYGTPKKQDTIFNTPIVLYTHKEIVDALDKKGMIIDLGNGAKGVDTKALAELVINDTKWSDLGLNDLYGLVTISTTDPVKSNSGNMFAGLMADVLSDSGVANQSNVNEVIKDVQKIFTKNGMMTSSSADLFDNFLKMGVGAIPIAAGYESQIIEFSVEHPKDWEELKGDVEVLYPVPTVWSQHPYIALDENGAIAIEALKDEEIQKLAWENHGFRTGIANASADTGKLSVSGIVPVVNKVINMPDADTMEKLIDALSDL